MQVSLLLSHDLELSVGVCHKSIYSDDNGDAELDCVLDLLAEVAESLFDQIQILLLVLWLERNSRGNRGSTTVHLERAGGGNQYNGVGGQARRAALK
jgi:hypothetical protein